MRARNHLSCEPAAGNPSILPLRSAYRAKPLFGVPFRGTRLRDAIKSRVPFPQRLLGFPANTQSMRKKRNSTEKQPCLSPAGHLWIPIDLSHFFKHPGGAKGSVQVYLPISELCSFRSHFVRNLVDSNRIGSFLSFRQRDALRLYRILSVAERA